MPQNIINIGYARVSTHKQDLGLEVQIDALRHCDRDHLFFLSSVNLDQIMHAQSSKRL